MDDVAEVPVQRGRDRDTGVAAQDEPATVRLYLKDIRAVGFRGNLFDVDFRNVAGNDTVNQAEGGRLGRRGALRRTHGGGHQQRQREIANAAFEAGSPGASERWGHGCDCFGVDRMRSERGILSRAAIQVGALRG